MKAYMIVRCVIHDREKFISGYGAQAAKLLEKYGGKYLIRAPGAIPLEGIEEEDDEGEEGTAGDSENVAKITDGDEEVKEEAEEDEELKLMGRL